MKKRQLSEDERKILKWKKRNSFAFRGVEPENQLSVANFIEQLCQKIALGEDVNLYLPMTGVICGLAQENYTTFDLDNLIKFVKPRYYTVKDKIDQFHNIDEEVYLTKRCLTYSHD